jgi:DNA-binding Lrp family transcriptional regulator
MTENQRAILDKLQDGDMSVVELAEELHIPSNPLRKIINNMERNGWLKKEGNYYTIARNYAPNIEWNFKPLLQAWKP